MKTTAVLLAAVTLSCVVIVGGAGASVAAAETPTSPTTTPSATVAADAETNDERAAAVRSSGGVTADQTVAADQGTPTVPASAPRRPARVRAKVSRFTLSSSTWRSDAAAPKINLRIAASKATAARAQVRIERGRRIVARQSLGVVRSGVDVTKSVTPRISAQPGSYRLRLIVRDQTGRKSQVARVLRVTQAPVEAPAPVTTPTAAVGGYVFPVQGACNFRSLSSQRFQAGRSGGRLHNGQDIGTFSDYPPVVAVTAATVERVWYDDAGGGWTIVFNGDDRIAYGYLHLKEGTITVKAGDRVAPGQVVANAGRSGGNYDPHLHFEMRPIPWSDNRASAIDPMPFLSKLPNPCSG